jgi:hypothetical protein
MACCKHSQVEVQIAAGLYGVSLLFSLERKWATITCGVYEVSRTIGVRVSKCKRFYVLYERVAGERLTEYTATKG